MGIRAKVLSLVTFSAIAPVLLVGVASYLTARNILVSKVTSELSAQAEFSAERVKRWLEERESDANVFASSFVVSENLNRWKAALLTGDQHAVEEARGRIQGYLAHIQGRYPIYRGMWTVNTNGILVAEAGPSKCDRDELNRCQFPTYIPGVMWAENEFFFYTKSQVRNQDDDPLGTLLIKSEVTDLRRQLIPVHETQKWELRVIDRIGRPITDSRVQPPDLGSDIATEGAQKCVKGEDGISEYRNGYGTRVLGAYQPIDPYGLCLLVEMDAATAFSTVSDLRLFSLLVSALAVTLVILLGYVMVVGMLRPIEALTIGAVAISEGDLDVEIPISSDDEIGYLTRVFNDMTTSLRDIHLTLEKWSTTDELTGLHNRRHLTRAFSAELNRFERTGAPLALLLIDVDHFKAINDRFGHYHGDALLHSMGSFLSNRTRSLDIVARYGGDEFVVLLPGVDKEQAPQKAESLRKEFEDARLSGKEYPSPTVSIGVALCPQDGHSQEDLLKRADEALYEAKRSGRNRVVVFDEEARRKN